MSRSETGICCAVGALLTLLSTGCERRKEVPPPESVETAARGSAASVAWGEAVNGLRCRIECPKKMLRVGRNLELKLTLQNVSQEKILVYRYGAPPKEGSWLDVVGPDGEQVQYIGEAGSRAVPRKEDYVWLDPGGTLEQSYSPDDFYGYELAEPGRYRITARWINRPGWATGYYEGRGEERKWVEVPAWMGELRSNTLFVDVIRPEIAWGEAVNGLRCGLVPEPSCTAGQPLRFEIRLANVSEQPRTYFHPDPVDGNVLELECVNSAHEKVRMFLPASEAGAIGDNETLGPGRSADFRFVLTYHLKPEVYRIRAIYRRNPESLPDVPSGAVSSGVCEFKVDVSRGPMPVIAWGKAANGLQVGLEVGGRSYETGSAIGVAMHARNVGDKDLRLYDIDFELAWDVVFTPGDGRKPRPALNIDRFAPVEWIRNIVRLAPTMSMVVMRCEIGGEGWKFPTDARAFEDFERAKASPDSLPPVEYAVIASYEGPADNLGEPPPRYWRGKVTTGAVEIGIVKGGAAVPATKAAPLERRRAAESTQEVKSEDSRPAGSEGLTLCLVSEKRALRIFLDAARSHLDRYLEKPGGIPEELSARLVSSEDHYHLVRRNLEQYLGEHWKELVLYGKLEDLRWPDRLCWQVSASDERMGGIDGYIEASTGRLILVIRYPEG